MEQKPKVFNLNNFVASETGRLTSLSVKRDLSLGGNKQKKVYRPNLNVVRNKNKTKITTTSKIQRQHQSKRNTRSLPSRTNQSQRYIQSGSVFSEGAGEIKRPTIHSDRCLNRGERDHVNITLPSVVKTDWDVSAEEEKTVINELLAEDDDSSSEDEGDYNPVILPLRKNKVGFLKTYQVKKEDPEEKEIKEEITKSTNNIELRDRITNYNVPLSFQDNKFYDEDHPCISLFRMPDSLPGKGFVEDSDKVIDFDLNQMIEGKIGKVLIRRSGKIEVKIGYAKYVLDSIESNPFKEDLMFIPQDLKPSSSNRDMIDLGNIDEKYILSPSWKNLFHLKDLKKK